MDNEIEVLIFNGPKESFEEYIQDLEDYKTLTEIAIEFDISKNKRDFPPNFTKNIVIYSDEYGSVSDGFLQNFIVVTRVFNVEKIFIQNPPRKLVTNIKRHIDNESIKERNYSFDPLTESKIKEFSARVDNEIIGQDSAIREFKTTLLSHIKFNKIQKPLVVMLYGPSGVGKTETCKILSNVINNNSSLFVKYFSMYQNNNAINSLYGDKLSDESFAKELLDRKSNVLLIDEFDKANDICYSSLYQLFDEGIYVDRNYKVNLKNSIIVCTSNYNSLEEIQEKLGEPIYYRFDKFIKYNKLSTENKRKIIEKKYDKYKSDLNLEDQNVVEKSNVKTNLLDSAHAFQNVRNIDSLIKETLSYILLENIESSNKN